MKKILTMLLLFGLMTPISFAKEVGQDSDDVDCTKIFEGSENKGNIDNGTPAETNTSDKVDA